VTLSDEVYARLLALRTGLAISNDGVRARRVPPGLRPPSTSSCWPFGGTAIVEARPSERWPTICFFSITGAVGLIDRADAAGPCQPNRDEEDHRVVRLHLTADGAKTPGSTVGPSPRRACTTCSTTPWGMGRPCPSPADTRLPRGAFRSAGSKQDQPVKVGIARVYDEVGKDPDRRVLVDRLWPRGWPGPTRRFEKWAKDVAPSSTAPYVVWTRGGPLRGIRPSLSPRNSQCLPLERHWRNCACRRPQLTRCCSLLPKH